MQRDQRRKICRYYAKGRCVKENCPFVHQQQTKKPCKFYTETGFCRKGKNCEFYHGGKQEEKKDKKFQQKQHKVMGFKKYTHKKQQIKKQIPKKALEQFIEEKQAQVIQHENKHQHQQKTTENKDSKHNQPVDLIELELKEQMYQELVSKEQNLQKKDAIQFFKIYPKSFPDRSKLPETKQHIRNIEESFFKNVPFLEFIQKIENPSQKQYFQIVRRYQDSFRLTNEKNTKNYTIQLRPLLYNKQMNLHFPLQQDWIQINVNQIQYPDVKARFEILNDSMSEAYKRNFAETLQKIHQKKTIFETIKYFQNNFEKIYEKVKSKLENQHFKKLQLKQQIQMGRARLQQQQEKKKAQKKLQEERQRKQQKAQKIRFESEKNQIKDHKAQNYNEPKKSAKKDQKNTEKKLIAEEKVIKEYRDYTQLEFNEYEKPQHQNLNDQITVESLLMQNCGYLVVEKILLYIECICSRTLMYLFDGKGKKQLKLWIKLRCKKCNDCIRIVWQRQVIQHKQLTISRMSLANGKIIDIGGIDWKIGCNCDQQIIRNKLQLPGQRMQLNCHTCFEQMNILYNGIKNFNPFVKDFQMQLDKELPLKGACNHEKLNFRWIRYACCGRPFSCDQCHTLGSIKKHQIVQGLTMICGYCAFEQAVNSQCGRCKKGLLKGTDKAGHWQGGYGCRDQNLLSKKDAKKYSGMTKQKKKQKQKEK